MATVMGEQMEAPSAANVVVVVKHAMGKGEVQVEVPEDSKLADVRQAVIRQLATPPKRLRFVRLAGTAIVTLADDEPLGGQREVLAMGDLSAAAAAGAAPASRVQAAVAPPAAAEPAPALPPAAESRPAAEAQEPVAAPPAAAESRPAAEAAEAAPADEPGLEMSLAASVDLLQQFVESCESHSAQLQVLENRRKTESSEADGHPRGALRTGGAGTVFAEVCQGVLSRAGLPSDRAGMDRAFWAVQQYAHEPEVARLQKRIEQVLRVPVGSYWDEVDVQQHADPTSVVGHQGGGDGSAEMEVFVEQPFAKQKVWVRVPQDATALAVKQAIARLGHEQMLSHGQLALRKGETFRHLRDDEQLGAHRSLTALGVDFTVGAGARSRPLLPLSRVHDLLESLWASCLSRTWNFKADPHSTAYRTLVGGEFAVACQKVVLEFGFTGDRPGFEKMFGAILAHLGDPAVQVLTKHIEELLGVPRGSWFGIIGDLEMERDAVPVLPLAEKEAPSAQEAPPKSGKEGPSDVERAEVVICHPLSCLEFEVTVPETATLGEVLEAIAEQFGGMTGRIVERVPGGSELVHCNPNEPLGSRRRLLWLGGAASPAPAPAPSPATPPVPSPARSPPSSPPDTKAPGGASQSRAQRIVDCFLARVREPGFRAELDALTSGSGTAFQQRRAALVMRMFAEFGKQVGVSVNHAGFKQISNEIAQLRKGDKAVLAQTDEIERRLQFRSGEMFSSETAEPPVASAVVRSVQATAETPESKKAKDLLERILQALSKPDFQNGVRQALRECTPAAFRAKRAALFVRSIGNIPAEEGFSLDHAGFRRMWASVALQIKDPEVQRRVDEVEDVMLFQRGELLSGALGGEDQNHRDSQAHRDERARPAKPARARAG